MLHSSNILVLHITLHKCFIIMIGVHGRSMISFCSLEGLNNKEQGGSEFDVPHDVPPEGNIKIHSRLALYYYMKL